MSLRKLLNVRGKCLIVYWAIILSVEQQSFSVASRKTLQGLTAAMPEGCRALLGGEAGEERMDEE